MIVTFGIHKGKSAIGILFNEPIYAKWVVKQKDIDGPLKHLQNEINRLISIWDRKKLNKKCKGLNCTNRATRFSFYDGASSLHPWCEDCEIYQSSDQPGKLSIGKTYLSIVKHAERTCPSKKATMKAMLRSYAKAKGMPTRMTKQAVRDFFVL